MTTALTIQQTAAHSGLTVHTLRYYEKIGLIKPVARRANGHRLYAPHDLEWIAFLLRLRETGMPLEAMRRFAELREAGAQADSLAERRAMLAEHAGSVVRQIAELQDTLGYLQRKVALYASMESQLKEESNATEP